MERVPTLRLGQLRERSAKGFRVWHLSLLVLFVAVAIENMKDQRLSDPRLIALASAGFLGYGVLGWMGWRVARRLEPRVGSTVALCLYLVAMSALFLAATGIYLVLEYRYLTGGW